MFDIASAAPYARVPLRTPGTTARWSRASSAASNVL